MALNDYRDLECDANGATLPPVTKTQESILDRLEDFWRDYEA